MKSARNWPNDTCQNPLHPSPPREYRSHPYSSTTQASSNEIHTLRTLPIERGPCVHQAGQIHSFSKQTKSHFCSFAQTQNQKNKRSASPVTTQPYATNTTTPGAISPTRPRPTRNQASPIDAIAVTESQTYLTPFHIHMLNPTSVIFRR